MAISRWSGVSSTFTIAVPPDIARNSSGFSAIVCCRKVASDGGRAWALPREAANKRASTAAARARRFVLALRRGAHHSQGLAASGILVPGRVVRYSRTGSGHPPDAAPGACDDTLMDTRDP